MCLLLRVNHRTEHQWGLGWGWWWAREARSLSYRGLWGWVPSISLFVNSINGLPWWVMGKETACNAGVAGSITGSGRYPRVEHGNPLQYSCLENPTDRGAWRTIAHGIAKSQSGLKRLEHTHTIVQTWHLQYLVNGPYFSRAHFLTEIKTQIFSIRTQNVLRNYHWYLCSPIYKMLM